MSDKRLLKVSAFYKNDGPNGIGLIIDGGDYDLEGIMCEYAEGYEEAWRVASEFDREKYVAGYADQLKYFGKLRAKDRSEEQNFTCLMNIWFLEKYGFLTSDDHNGCQFVYDAAD
jgi:hypothetical protein